MKVKSFLILAGVAAVLVIAAIYSSRQGTQGVPEAIGKPILPDFDVTRVASVDIKTRDAATTIRQVNDTWAVVERFGYPADFSRLRNAMKALQTAKVIDKPRLSSQQREALGVAAPPAGDAKSTSITFADSGGTTLATLLLGKEHMRQDDGGPMGGYPDGRYVSSDGGDTVYLADSAFSSLSPQPQNWIDKSLLKVNASDLTRVVITARGGESIELARSGDDDSLVLVGTADNETTDTTELSSVRNALSYFDMSDIASPALGEEQMGFANAATFMAETEDGIAYTLTIGGKAEGNNHYIKIAAEKLDLPEPQGEEGESADDVPRDVQAEVDALNHRFSKWTFIIPGYKAESMLKTRDDLVETKEEKEGSAEEAAPLEVTTEPVEIPADPAGSGAK